jgi:hypothetical protein
MLSAGLRSAIAALVASFVVLVPAVHAHEQVRAPRVVAGRMVGFPHDSFTDPTCAPACLSQVGRAAFSE